jgi:hypothetical protein
VGRSRSSDRWLALRPRKLWCGANRPRDAGAEERAKAESGCRSNNPPDDMRAPSPTCHCHRIYRRFYLPRAKVTGPVRSSRVVPTTAHLHTVRKRAYTAKAPAASKVSWAFLFVIFHCCLIGSSDGCDLAALHSARLCTTAGGDERKTLGAPAAAAWRGDAMMAWRPCLPRVICSPRASLRRYSYVHPPPLSSFLVLRVIGTGRQGSTTPRRFVNVTARPRPRPYGAAGRSTYYDSLMQGRKQCRQQLQRCQRCRGGAVAERLDGANRPLISRSGAALHSTSAAMLLL